MENKITKNYIKGNKSTGKNNWSNVVVSSNKPKIDEENPELVGKKQFKKVIKNR